jgi:simple sugar transport system ATP-binding protein
MQTTAGKAESAVKLKGITKYFPGVVANDHVSLDVRKGEVLALLGENGAGKSTLMKILYGMYQPDAGQIVVEGRSASIRSPQDAMNLGIGMIHQHFTLVPVHSVVENILLGAGKGPKAKMSAEAAAREITRIGAAYGLEVEPEALVYELPVGIQQRVEILKALFRGAKTLIMDEPTAVLTPQETERLFDFIRDFTREGNSVVFITHKLQEVLELADRIGVLRNGKVVGELSREDASEKALARMMVGREMEEMGKKAAPGRGAAEKVLQISGLWVKGSRGHWAVENLDLEICGGEILGLAGVSGNGQEELAEAICGLREAAKGDIQLKGRPILGKDAAEIIRTGVGYIPSDRHREGLVLDMSVKENLILKRFDSKDFSGKGILKESKIRKYSESLIRRYSIKTSSPEERVRELSGGNQQKVVVAREMDVATSLLVAVQPTRGLDLGAADYVHRTLLGARSAGKAILLVSTELSEILFLSDKIGVMYRGRILKFFDPTEVDIEEIGLAMMGVVSDEP